MADASAPRARFPLGRLVRAGVGLAILVFVIRTLAGQWQSIRAEPLELRLSVPWLALSLALALTAYAIMIAGWRAILRGHGESLGARDAARIWLLASLGKYLPGKVWALAGAAILAREHGIDPTRSLMASLVMHAFAFVTAAWMGLTFPGGLVAIWPAATTPILAALGTALVAILVAISRPRAAAWSHRIPGSWHRNLLPITPRTQAIALAANAVAWIVFGLGLSALGRGLSPAAAVPWDAATTAFAFSYLVGFAAPLAPGGLGVRESAFVMLLEGRIGAGPALVLAVASRIVLTLADLVAATVALTLERPRPPVD